MAIDFPQFQRIGFAEANPALAGAAAGQNLVGNNLDIMKKAIINRYLPLTQQAEAGSKLAYANLMGPQFLAKLLGNQDILANIPDAQKGQALNFLLRAGGGQGTGNGFTNPYIGQNLGNFSDQNLSNSDRSNIGSMQPGQSYTVQGNRSSQNGMPEQPENFGMPANKSFAENVGEYTGTKEEGKKLGELRAKDIDDLSTNYYSAKTQQTTLDQLSKILSSPQFEQIRQIPLAGHHELSYYSKLGTPEQQSLVGQYYTATGDIIRNSARDFPGQFRRGEQQLLQSMKPNPSDTVDTARGKVESLSYFNKMFSERARLTAQYMHQNHMTKAEALDLADKQIDGNAIRKAIQGKLYPDTMITIRHKQTGQVVTIPKSEAKSKYGVE